MKFRSRPWTGPLPDRAYCTECHGNGYVYACADQKCKPETCYACSGTGFASCGYCGEQPDNLWWTTPTAGRDICCRRCSTAGDWDDDPPHHDPADYAESHGRERQEREGE